MTEDTFEGWMLVELLGRRKFAGLVREVEIAGAGLLRIDVPAGAGPALTTFVPVASLYAITPITEALAREYAVHNSYQPITAWELPRPQLTARETEEPTTEEEYEYQDDDYDEGNPR